MLDMLHIAYDWIYLAGGSLTVFLALLIYRGFPHFKGEAEQHKNMILRQCYWLYYVLTFLSGARRQIFVVFAGFLMVEKFAFSASEMAMLFLVNGVLTIYLAPKIGLLVKHWGERRTLTLEYIGLIIIFTSYAFVESVAVASLLYILDHLFFAMAIALKSYFKKIADPADFASTAGVAFSINHIAAVLLPFALGFLWILSPSWVFLTGSGIALLSLLLSQLVPSEPSQGQETTLLAPQQEQT
jgi:predicted MFS family arabinose efflux permease